jgi:hypothetical protein
MGEGLWTLRKDVEAAHVCMVLAGEEVTAADAPACRMALIGADHRRYSLYSLRLLVQKYKY